MRDYSDSEEESLTDEESDGLEIPDAFTDEEESDRMEDEIVAPPLNINYTRRNLQHEYRHAGDFGIRGNPNNENLGRYREAIQQHIDAAPNIYISTYMGQQVFVYINPATSIGAYVDMNGNYIGGWRFSDRQMQYHANHGRRIQ